MIFISYGMPKSASSFAYLLANEVCEAKTPRWAVKAPLPESLQGMYIGDVSSNLDTLVQHVPKDQVYCIKTHQPLDDTIRAHIEAGNAIGSVSFRDPYDVLVSMLDAGRREREKPEHERRMDFAVFETVDDVLAGVKNYLWGASTWLDEVEDLPGFVKVYYEDLRQRPADVVRRFADVVGVYVDADAIVAKYLSNTGLIWEYNKGQSGRGYREIEVPEDHPTRRLLDEFKQKYGIA